MLIIVLESLPIGGKLSCMVNFGRIGLTSYMESVYFDVGRTFSS